MIPKHRVAQGGQARSGLDRLDFIKAAFCPLEFNAVPLGGFVKLKGEHDTDTEKGSYGAARTSTKVKIMLAGVAMNLVTALVL